MSPPVTARRAGTCWRSTRTGAYVEDVQELLAAIEEGKAETGRPTLIVLKTIIGYQAPNKKDTDFVHGNALGGRRPRRSPAVRPTRAAWQANFHAWAAAQRRCWTVSRRRRCLRASRTFFPCSRAAPRCPTRAASGKVVNALAPELQELWGGSADLAGSNNTTITPAASFIPAEWSTHDWNGSPYGRVLHFGIREHAMGPILNGITLHGPTRAFGGTFLIFSDYMRPPVRLAALMNVPSIFVWTHDSVPLGEDGPTHQTVEQLATLRAIPNFTITVGTAVRSRGQRPVE